MSDFMALVWDIEESNPSKDPVVLWLNGGPGCSSMDGFVFEHGPFNFEKPKTKGTLPNLHLNPYSWSKVSNIIYLDSPAGVGFSYSKNKADYRTGDVKTAIDSHNFLLEWFKLYPEFLSNPLFLAGESFAGIYIPTLAQQIVQGFNAGAKPKLNFKGYLIGNGVTDNEFDGNAIVPYAHGMGLISDQIFEDIKGQCLGRYHGRINNITCLQMMLKVDKVLGSLNPYDTLEPCYHGSENTKSDNRLPLSFRKLGETDKPMPVRRRMFGRAWPLGQHVKSGIVPTWPELSYTGSVPCFDDEVGTVWLNNEAVRKAIHTVDKSVVDEWKLCTNNIEYNHDEGSMIEFHKKLTSNGYRALIYSGDHDLCVPYTGSEAWTSSLGYKIIDEWRAWLVDGQVAGFTQGYEKNLTFLTIKGAGHTVPEYKPKESLYFYKRFLDGLPM
ncbi:hypothetical protein TanjilG_10485 [Lupinus angustifolius]|uniref:Uncharacterized protein n=1 Tax=Lupinus angustifolius TaxID=3871 RepID=A0A4P1R497_LUPAN|nr:hypothetical protein TanjilG_10485 [Lupinus angustifolius]